MPLPKKTAKRNDDDELSGLKKIKDIKRRRSFVLYGRSGSGKTTLAADFPKPMLYLDIKDEGTDSIADVEGIDVKEITCYEDIESTLHWLLRNPKKYKTVVLDTMSQLQEILVDEVGQNNKKKNGKKPGEWGSMSKQDWGEVSSKMKSLVIDFRDLPLEVVFIAQDKTFGVDDEDGDNQLLPEVGPRLMPSVATVMNAAVSVIGCTFIRRKLITKVGKDGKKVKTQKTVYCLRIGPSPVYTTKMRKPKEIELPDFLEDPTYEDLIDIITGDA